MEIAIIGGGIGGLAAALALERAGHMPTVYERSMAEAHAEPQGVFLTLAVNGIAALAALGDRGAGAELGFQTGAIRFASGRGKDLGTLPIGPRLADGTTARTVRRSDLLGLLASLARERGIEVRTGHELAAVEGAGVPARSGRSAPSGADWAAEGVELTFAGGGRARADLLIGADGIHSRVRSLVYPDAPAPRYTGVLNAGGFARVPDLAWEGGDYWMTWGQRCFFGHTVAPDGTVWWFANPPERREPARGELATRSTDDVRAYLADLLAADDGPGAAIVGASDGPLTLWAQHDLPSIKHWTTARTALLGDAAHAVSPTTGQGASLAIEDAVVLARLLADRGVSLAQALAAYQAARQSRTDKIAAWGRRTGNTKTAGPIGRRITDLMMPPILKMAGSGSAQRRQAWIHEFDPSA